MSRDLCNTLFGGLQHSYCYYMYINSVTNMMFSVLDAYIYIYKLYSTPQQPLPVCLSASLLDCLFVCISVYMSACFVNLPVYFLVCWSIYISIPLCISISIYDRIISCFCLSIFFSFLLNTSPLPRTHFSLYL